MLSAPFGSAAALTGAWSAGGGEGGVSRAPLLLLLPPGTGPCPPSLRSQSPADRRLASLRELRGAAAAWPGPGWLAGWPATGGRASERARQPPLLHASCRPRPRGAGGGFCPGSGGTASPVETRGGLCPDSSWQPPAPPAADRTWRAPQPRRPGRRRPLPPFSAFPAAAPRLALQGAPPLRGEGRPFGRRSPTTKAPAAPGPAKRLPPSGRLESEEQARPSRSRKRQGQRPPPGPPAPPGSGSLLHHGADEPHVAPGEHLSLEAALQGKRGRTCGARNVPDPPPATAHRRPPPRLLFKCLPFPRQARLFAGR